MKRPRSLLLPLLFAFTVSPAISAEELTVATVASDMTIGAGDNLHITAASDAVAAGAVIDIRSEDARLFFDNVRPLDVISKYASNITINGQPFKIDDNVRVFVNLQGSQVLPHGQSYTPMTAFTGTALTGESEKYELYRHYTNAPSSDVKKAYLRELRLDDCMRSFTLARGYMATLATNPDGTGYSRCFIAEDENLTVDLPYELAGKVSYVRVFDWTRPTKKGWVGGNGKTNPPEGYLEEQADMTGSTWVYNWGTSADWGRSPSAKTGPWRNQEYVPEKWGYGGSSDWSKLANSKVFTHLLSYNEPDHSEQSHVTVEEALAEWPRHLQTGLRLGSPATTDFGWLYRFMEGARKNNYRVDYVAIHAYWGGSGGAVVVTSVADWYRKLKEVHERTGCPLWITEWNNGANWTHEAWPSDKDEQYEKQRKFMDEVLNMMDTCAFIERYSIYNWVEQKRAIIDSEKNLTPAGIVYRDFKAAPAFSRQTEVVPRWDVKAFSNVAIDYIGDRRFRLSWSDPGYEQVDGYDVEMALGYGPFGTVDHAPYKSYSHEVELDRNLPAGTDVSYRVVSQDRAGERYPSNVVGYGTITQAPSVLVGRKTMDKGVDTYIMPAGFSSDPVAVLGVQTYNMKSAMLPALGAVDPDICQFGPVSWKYNASDSFVSQDSLSYMVFPAAGYYDLGGIRAYAAKIDNVGTEAVHVRFPDAFAGVPVVFASVHSAANEYPSVARVANVTAEGFDLCIAHEKTAANPSEAATVSYVAMTTGSGTVDGHRVAVGLARDTDLHIVTAYAVEIPYGSDFGNTAFFAALQTPADDLVSTLRAASVSGKGAKIFKSCEISSEFPAQSRENVGWCAISDIEVSGLLPVTSFADSSLTFDPASRAISLADGSEACIEVYNLAGSVALAGNAPFLPVASLAPGVYIARAAGHPGSLKFCITY